MDWSGLLKRTLQTLLCVLTALHLCGGPLGLLQVVTWAQMARAYTMEKGFIEGVSQTFDGEHPCPKCLRLEEARNKERQQNPQPLDKLSDGTKWLTMLPTLEMPLLCWKSLLPEVFFINPSMEAAQWLEATPAPPPRRMA